VYRPDLVEGGVRGWRRRVDRQVALGQPGEGLLQVLDGSPLVVRELLFPAALCLPFGHVTDDFQRPDDVPAVVVQRQDVPSDPDRFAAVRGRPLCPVPDRLRLASGNRTPEERQYTAHTLSILVFPFDGPPAL
jgi:hypothetical protein